jgi:hypothetical protein
LPVAPVEIDCCLTKYKKEQLREIPLQKPLTNILSSVEDLNLASVKIDEYVIVLLNPYKWSSEYNNWPIDTDSICRWHKHNNYKS